MNQVLHILWAAALTFAVSLLVGNAVLKLLRAKLARSESFFLGFVIGAALLSAVVFALAWAGLARKGAFLAASVVLISAAVAAGGHRLGSERLPSIPKPWLAAFCLLYIAFGTYYASVALAPEISVDGTTHYLAKVSRDARAFGFAAAWKNPRPAVPDGVSVLFLYAFAIRQHSAAAMVELLFVLMCPLGMLSYGRRIQNPAAGVAGALLFFLSPIIGKTGSAANLDAAIACVLFALFYLVDMLLAGHQLRLLAPIALLSGFAAWAIVPWMRWNSANPVLDSQAWYPEAPFDLAIRGVRLHGLLGPVFLLAPLIFLALRYPAGRRLVPAALLCALPYFASMQTRSLIPCLPFVSLALALVLNAWRMAPWVLLVHALLSWPAAIFLYSDPGAWRLESMDWNAAFRIEPETDFLSRSVPGYRMLQYVDTWVPSGEPVFSLTRLPQSYLVHEIVNGQDTAFGRRARSLILSQAPDELLAWRYDFRFTEQPLRRLRVAPGGLGGGDRWDVAELHVFRQGLELPQSLAWRIRAAPNPLDADFALDRDPLTHWSSGRDYWRDTSVDLDFRATQSVDEILVECAADRPFTLRLEREGTHGQWENLASTATASGPQAPLPELRRAAIRTLKSAGIGWLLVPDAAASGIWQNPSQWGIKFVTRLDSLQLYSLE